MHGVLMVAAVVRDGLIQCTKKVRYAGEKRRFHELWLALLKWPLMSLITISRELKITVTPPEKQRLYFAPVIPEPFDEIAYQAYRNAS